ncbi:hypothetical protein Vadar_004705 [Vaccinium darrowii]|uniref:Uncharacterized protein n=1 Tax=Vaccinium darrowii TaxID=229202 RepID=A0ACB7WY05_9ERIC|nr:hypothetical protein Vadar_004705 [Vaccinium darrowii]
MHPEPFIPLPPPPPPVVEEDPESEDDFRRRRVPINDSNERFNKVQSSLRGCVKRAFGVLKRRFCFLKIASQYDFQEAKKFIHIAMGLHNYIRMHYPSDEYFKDTELGNGSYVFEDRTSRDIRQEFMDRMRSAPKFAQTDREMNLLHDGIRDRIALDYSRGRNQRGRAS